MNPCWILCTPRSGSTYLCELLNNTGLYPAFEHPRLHTQRGPLEMGRAFDEWLRAYDGLEQFRASPPRFLKAIHHHLFEIWPAVTHTDIVAILPGIKYVMLQRTDKIKQAVSQYLARELDRYHLYNTEMVQQYRASPININVQQLLQTHQEVCTAPQCWQEFLVPTAKVYEVTYEDLDADPFRVMGQIIEFTGMQTDAAVIEQSVRQARERLHRMDHPVSKQCEDMLLSVVQ